MNGAGSTRGRARFALRAIVLLLAVTASCALLAVLGSQLRQRFDVTATRQHRLAPATKAVVEALDQPVELVIAADFATLDRATRERAADVLDRFAAASPKLRVTTIDTTNLAGLAAFDALLVRLADRDRPAIDRHLAALRAAADQAEIAATALAGVSERLAKVRDALRAAGTALPNGPELARYWEGQSAAGRILTDELRAAARAARETLSKNADPLPIPDLDLATRQLRIPISKLASELTTLNTAVDTFARQSAPPAMPQPARDEAAEVGAILPPLRDTLARAAITLERLGLPPIVGAARVIQRTRAGLVIGAPAAPGESGVTTPPAGLAAIDLDDLLPLPGPDGSVDLRGRAEEVIAAGLARFTNEVRPLVVFTHAASQRLGADLGPLRRTAERLSLRGIDSAEWAVALDEQPPPAATPKDARPVVFATISIEITSPDSALRMGRLAKAVKGLVDTGRPVLLSVNPSSLPGVGAPDPMADFLPALGVVADSGRPLLEEIPIPGSARRNVATDVLFADPLPALGTNAIASAIAGLNTVFPWAIPLRIKNVPEGISATPVVEWPAAPGRWAESQWQALRQTPPARREAASDLPALDSPGDDAGGPGPWTIAVAIERDGQRLDPPRQQPQRLVVVGSNGWFFDSLTQIATVVDGRPRLETPGNTELLAACVAWLAGREGMIARGPTTQAAPTIPNLTDGQIAALRWVLIAALPMAVLLAGVLVRWWRG